MKLAANGSASFPRLCESSNGEEGGEESMHEPGEEGGEGGEKFDARASVSMEKDKDKCDRRLCINQEQSRHVLRASGLCRSHCSYRSHIDSHNGQCI